MAKSESATTRPKVGRKLKVFQATIGFYDTVVAVPSQAAALRAWGTHQNLFKDGVAGSTDDEKAGAAALARPGVVLRRALGTTDPFSLGAGVPKIPDLPRGRKKEAKTAAEEPHKPPDRTPLDRAEADLGRLEGKRRAEEDAFVERRRNLEAEEAKASARFEEARDSARDRVERERQAYVNAGGPLKR